MLKIKKIISNKKNNKVNIIPNIYLFLVALVMLYASFLSLKNIFEINFKSTILISVIYITLLYVTYKIINKLNFKRKWQEIVFLILIIIFGLILRAGAYHIFKTEPVSDFAIPHEVYNERNNGIFDKRIDMSSLSYYQNYYSLYPSWFSYMKIVFLIYNIFGQNLNSIIIMNYILYIFSIILIYLICRENYSIKNGYIASILFSIYPSLILYSNITTPDHFTILLFLALIYSWLKVIKNRSNNIKKTILYSILNIIIFCLINLFKPLSIFGICVIIGTEILCYLVNVKKINFKQYLKKDLVYFLLFIICGFIGIKIETKILYNTISKTINNEVVDSFSFYMLWGYAIDENKIYKPSIGDTIIKNLNLKYDYNQKLVTKEVSQLAKDQFKNNLPYLPSILNQKFKLAFNHDTDIFNWANTSVNKSNIAYKYSNKFHLLSNVFNFTLYFLISLTLFKEINKLQKDKLTIIISLIVIGYIAVLVLGGVQSRYKSLIYGPMCLLAASSLKFKKEEKE